MGFKEALTVMARAREGRANSMAEIEQAQRTLGCGLGQVRTGCCPTCTCELVEQTDDEDLSDQAVA